MKKMNEKLSKSRWSYVARLCALCLIVVMLTAFAVGCRKDPVDDKVPTSDGAEIGVYYYELVDGEALLTLSSGNNFTLVGPLDNKTGTYTVNENQIVLDFLKDEDGTTTATISGDTVVLNYNNGTMSFTKKVNYTVSFNANGGSSVASATVVNGKTVNKPEDPKKDGAVFIGWYTDNSFTTLYDFASAVVKANTTLYARWADKVIGQTEYNVVFDLGYASAEQIADKTTVGGKLYNVVNPTREGYVFGGWYVSMYEDGAKLSFAYTEDTVFDSDTTLYAVWHEEQNAKLQTPSVSVSGNSIKWTPVNGASTYQVKIYDANGTVLYEGNEGSDTYNYDFDARSAGDYKIEVTAVHSNASKNSDVAVRYYKNKALPRVSGFQVIDGVLIYNAVAGAEKYLVTVDCGNDEHTHTLFDNGNSTSFNFVNCSMQKGGIVFTVTAVANGRASSVSEKFVYDRSLSAIGGVAYNKADDVLVWDAVSGATNYIVTIVAGGETYVFDNSNKTSFSMANYTGEISVSVVPATAGYNSPDAASLSCVKTAPKTPTGITVSGMNVSWTAVEGATSYEVKLGAQVFTVTENSFSLNRDGLNLDKNEVYSVQVKAVKDNESSAYSAAVNVNYYVMGNTLVYKNNTVYWTPVAGVSTYEIRVNGEDTFTVFGVNSAKVALTKAGVNTIEVRCPELEGTEWISVSVVAYSVTYMSRTLDGEITEYLAVGDNLSVPTDFAQTGYSLTGWYNTPGAANGNGKPYTSSVFTGNGDMVLYANWTPNDYNIKFVVDSTITNVVDSSTSTVTYTKDYQLVVPVTTDSSRGYFVGWFDGPSGSGRQLTDAEGNAVSPYLFARDTVAYPFFETGILSYELLSNGTYGVKRGLNISNGINVKIPVEYKGVAVTAILDNGFYNCDSIIKLEIPDTITMVGVGAFDYADNIQEFVVYKAKEGETYETFYSSHDGALLYYDVASARTYLEVFPIAKTGTYTIPETVQSIKGLAFKSSAITKVVVGTNVTNIAPYAFYNSSIQTLEFAEGGTSPLVIEKEGLANLRGLTTLKLPARLQQLENIKDFDAFTSLVNISVEAGGTYYSSNNNMICNAIGDTILYIPVTFRGVFEPAVGITGIGDSVFAYNSKITEVIIPAYVTNIGKDAFKTCGMLSKVTFQGGRTSSLVIGESAFDGANINTLVFEGGENIDAGSIIIAKNAFANCVSLKSVTFNSGVNVASIGEGAFSNCIAIEAFAFNDGAVISSIGDRAFSGCVKLDSFTVPKTVSTIGAYAFSGCEHLETFAFAEGGTKVTFGNYAFDGCARLQTVVITDSVSLFDGSVFNGCPSIKEIKVSDNNANFKSENGVLYNGDYSEILFYPKALEADIDTIKALRWDSITKIGASVFSQNSKLTEMYVGPNVTVIGEHAFDSCLQLAKITFAENTAEGAALSIGAYAFANCKVLTEVPAPAYVNAIGEYAFSGSALSSFTIPAGVTSIENSTFATTKLTTISIPATVTFIGDAAFKSVTTLTEIIFLPAENGVGADLVIGTSGATSSTGAFYGTKLVTVDLPDRVTYIGAYAFYRVTTMTALNIGDGSKLAEIGNNAFYQANLTSINLGDSLVTIGDNAFQATKLTTVNVPASVEYIGKYTFGITTLKTATFDAGIAPLTIAEYAFSTTQISDIELPARLVSIAGVNSRYGVRTIDTVFNKNVLLNINVAEGGSKFASREGILYEVKDGVLDTLVYCPTAKTGTVTVPNTVTYIESGAFNGVKLEKLFFEEFDKNDSRYATPLLTIGNPGQGNSSYPAIGGTKTLREIRLPSHVKQIGLYGISGLASENVEDGSYSNGILYFNPDAEISIASNGICNNHGYVEIHLPKIKDMGSHAVYNNAWVSVLTMAPGSTFNTITPSAFANMNLSSFTVPASVKTIGSNAFYGNPMTEIFWEEGCLIEEIEANAFAYTEFVTFTIPDTVNYLGNTVWNHSETLQTIYISKSLDASSITSFTPFSGIENLKEIIVDPENPYLSSVDGVLFDYAKTKLYAYPVAKEGDVYTVPEGVTEIGPRAFYDYPGTAVILPSTLEVIGDRAFYDAGNLLAIAIPANVTTIAKEAFSNCSSATVLEFARGSVLRTIGERAFQSCDSLDTVILPDSLTKMGNYAFANNSGLKKIVLSASLETIPQYAFYSSTALREVVMQEGLRTIERYAFCYCDSLAGLVIPASLTTIDMCAFNLCPALESVEFVPNSELTHIASSVFGECPALKSIELPDSVKIMEAGVFYGCTSLRSAKLPASITTIPENTFYGCTALTEVVFPDVVTAIETRAFMDCVSLKSAVISKDVTSIGTSAFENCTSLEAINVEAGSKLSFIADGAFAGTTKLTTFDIPDAVTGIYARTFQNSGIADLKLPANLVVIGDSAFENCVNLTNADLPNSVTSVGARAFAGCKNLESANLSLLLKSIGASAYDGCEKLTSIHLPAGVSEIAGNPFTSCYGVTSFTMDPANENFVYVNGVLLDSAGYTLIYYSAANTNESYTIPETVREIGAGAFSGSKLKSIVVPDSITVIKEGTFLNSKSLESVTLPLQLMCIEAEAFKGCSALTTISIPASVMEIRDAAFSGCSSLTSVDYNDRIDYLWFGMQIFEYCTSITNVADVLPAGAPEFTEYMFRGIGIVDLVIPESIMSIQAKGVFAECKNLKTVTFHDAIGGMLGGEFFMNCTSLESIDLPDGITSIGAGRMPRFVGYSFAGCTSLKSVTVGPGMSMIRNSSFEGCTALETLTFRNIDPRRPPMIRVADRAFYNCVSLTSTDFIPYIQMMGLETFVNCASLSGRVDFTNSGLGEIPDGALFGCVGITEIHVMNLGRLSADTFSGLAEGTKIYFDANTLESLCERYGTEWYDSTKDYFEYHFAAETTGGRR